MLLLWDFCSRSWHKLKVRKGKSKQKANSIIFREALEKKQIIHIHFKKFKRFQRMIAPNPIRNAIKAQLAYDN